jgi:hypothetical protein
VSASARDAALRLGARLRCAPLEDEFEYRFMLDLTANTFLGKLVPKRVMDRKLDLVPGQYFRGLLVLSYATTVLFEEGGEKLLSNLGVLHAELKKANRKAAMPTALLATEIALFAREQPIDESAARDRHRAQGGAPCACDLAQLEPYYEAGGFMLLDQLAAKEAAARIGTKADLAAAVFTEALGGLQGSEAATAALGQRLLAGEHCEASLAALRGAAAHVSVADLERYFAS